jgi:integrase
MIKQTEKGYRVDIQPGGRAGQRFREDFAYLKDAKEFERQKITAWQRGEVLSTNRSAMPFAEYVDTVYIPLHVDVRMLNPGRSEIYRLNKFKAFFKRSLEKITQADGEKFIEAELKAGAMPGSINRNLVSLKRIFSWAIERGDLLINPMAKLKKFKTKARVRWCTHEEVQRLVACAKATDPSLADFILFAVNTGFRLGNLMRVERSHVFERFVTATTTKSGEPYDVPINAGLRTLLETLPATGRMLNTKKIDFRFREISKAAGLYRGPRHAESVTIHTLRHTFAAWALQSGVSIYTVQKWMGHHSVAITESTYGHLSVTHHTQEMQKFAGFSVDSRLTGQTGGVENV